MKIRQFQSLYDSSLTPFSVRFSRPKRADGNFFSILIGANGTRKSRTLRDIIDVASRMALRETTELRMKAGEVLLWGERSEPNRRIRKIIALSGVATDRFPSRLTLREKKERGDLYSYIGPRTENNLISRVQSINRLALSLLQGEERLRLKGRALSSLLKVVGNFRYIEFNFKTQDELTAALTQKQLLERLRKANREHRRFLWDEKEVASLLPKLGGIVNSRKAVSLRVEVHPAASLFATADIKAVEILVSAGLLTVDAGTIGFDSKAEANSLSELSSGQWHILSSLLFTAASVEDDTLFLVDEPENSLHPAWQQQYLGLMNELIEGATGVHVIVATHSPLVAASLPPETCEVIEIRESRGRLSSKLLPSGPFGWTADEILKDVFGLSSSRSIDFSQEMAIALRLFGEGERENSKLIRAVQNLTRLKEGLPDDDLARTVIETLSSVVLGRTADGSQE